MFSTSILRSTASRRLLNDGRSIPVLGYGVWDSKAGSGMEASDCITAILEAIKCGYRHIDTAKSYGNETEVGEAIRASGIPRSEFWVTTKLANEDHGYENAIAACNTSLSKLGLDYIDLYLLHAPADERYPESWRALVDLQAEGKVKSIGVSNFGVTHLDAIAAVSGVVPAVNQIEVHPYCTRPALTKTCEERGIVIEAFCPLIRGKKFSDVRLLELAAAIGKSPAQVLLRWSLQKGYIPLPASGKPERIAENAALFDFELSEEQMKVLDGFDEHFFASVTATKFAMRRTIRARPIDPYRRMWVISDPSVVYDDEEDAASDGLMKRGTVVDLPIPPVIDVQTYEKEHVADFVLSRPFIRYPIKPEGYEELELEYDLDHEDEAWLETQSRWGARADTRNRLTPGKLEELLDRLEKESGKLGGVEITLPQAIRLAKERLGIGNGHVVEDVYKYWQGKRARLRKPLLRRFWPATSPTDVNPHNVFRPRDKGRYNTRRQKKNDVESFMKMQQLREDLDRARSLLDYTRQREKLKLESLKLRIECFEQDLHDHTESAGGSRVSDALARADEIRGLYPSTKVFPMRVSSPGVGEGFRHRDSMGGYDETAPQGSTSKPQKMSGGALAGQRKDKARKPTAVVSRPLQVQRPTVFRPGWWTAPNAGVPAVVDDGQDVMEVGTALGLRPGIMPESRVLLAHKMGSALGKPEAGAFASRSTLNHSRLTLGRLSGVKTVGWEAAAGLVPGIGGLGWNGEGWENVTSRPEVQPPVLTEITPDLEIVYAIRSRRAERLMASHANIPVQVHAQTQQLLGSVAKAQQHSPQREPGQPSDVALPAPVRSSTPGAPSVEGGGSIGGKASAARARSTSVSVETVEALASALAESERGEVEARLEEMTASDVDSDDMSDEEDWLLQSRPHKKAKHAPDYYCRPRMGRCGRILIDRVPITLENSEHRAAAWLALRQRKEAKKQQEEHGKGHSCSLSNRWTWAKPGGLPPPPVTIDTASCIDLLDDSTYDRHPGFGSHLHMSVSAAMPKLRSATEWEPSQCYWTTRTGQPAQAASLNYSVATAGIYRDRDKRTVNVPVDAKEDASIRLATEWFSGAFPQSDVKNHVTDMLYGFV